ncbi:MAG: PAS domain S-box protein [Bacteroidales bacterium]|nr:PAS domain S-box protein [Bacteroidales bacterium]
MDLQITSTLSSSFENLRSKIVNSVMSVMLLVAIPLVIASVSRFTVTGWNIVYLFHIFFFFSGLAIFIYRKKISVKLKTWLINIIFLLLGITGFKNFGILGNDNLYFIVAVVLTGLFIGKKEGYLMLFIVSFVVIAYAILYTNNILHLSFNLEEYVVRPSVWISFVLVLLIIIFGLFAINDKYIDFFINSEKQLIENQRIILKNEQKYREIFNATSEAIFIHDAKTGKIIDVNDSTLKDFNCIRENIIGKTLENFSSNISPYTLNEANILIEKAKVEGVQIFEWQSKKYTGELFWTEVSLQYSNISGEEKIIAILRDISERKKIQLALAESEERFRLLIENIPAVTWVSNSKAETTYISPNIKSVYGYSLKEITEGGSDLWFGRIHPQDIELVKEEYNKLFQNNQEYNIEYRIKKKDNNWIWLHDKASVVQEIDGVKFAYGVFYDITKDKNAELEILRKHQELQAAEEELRVSLEKQEDINAELEEKNKKLNEAFKIIEENEMKYHALFNNANDSIFIVKNGCFIECNKKSLEMFGVKPDEILYHTPMEFSPELQPDGLKSIDKGFEKINKAINGEPQVFEWKHKKLNGELFDVEVVLNKIEFHGEKFLQAIVRDISDRKKSEQALIESEKKFRNIFNSSYDGILISDFNQNILNANKRITEFLGYSLDKVINSKVFNSVDPQYMSMLKRRLKILQKNGNAGFIEINIKNAEGKNVPVEISSSIIKYEDKMAILTILRDISERKQMHQKILNAIIDTEEIERSRFARELHDGLGPILSAIKLYYQWLAETNDPVKKDLIVSKGNVIIEEALISLKEISNNLSPHILNNFGLSDAVYQFIERVSETKKIKFIFQTDTKDRFKKEIEVTFYRTITELINNTFKHSNATEVNVQIKKDQKMNILLLRYKDNGIGFNVKKAKNKKGGLGLFNIENRINTIGGKIAIFSKPNEGLNVEASIEL